MIIDKTGKIVFKGHPAHKPDLKGDLEKLAGIEAAPKVEQKKD